MTEDLAAMPGWVAQRLDEVFAGLPPEAVAAREAYGRCLAGRKAPAAPSDLLGAEFEGCRSQLRRTLLGEGVDRTLLDRLDGDLETLEAEMAAES